MIVVDASLAAKWFLNEADSGPARSFLKARRGTLTGPDVLALEVSRALVAAANARRLATDAARAAIATWLESIESSVVTLHRVDPDLLRRGVDLALNLGHPLSDCLYLALAIDLDCDLVTCDAKFRDRAATLYPRIRLLAELS